MSNEYSFAQRKEKGVKLSMGAWFNAIPFIAGINGHVAADLKTQSSVVTTESPSTGDLLTYLDQIVSILREKASMKHVVIMIDETDKIRMSGEAEPTANSAIQFFSENLPVLEKNRLFVYLRNE